MGLFQHRREEEEQQWASLPSEPIEHGAADVLDTAPTVDPAGVEFGPAYTTMVFPVASPPAPAASTESREPGGDADPDRDDASAAD